MIKIGDYKILNWTVKPIASFAAYHIKCIGKVALSIRGGYSAGFSGQFLGNRLDYGQCNVCGIVLPIDIVNKAKFIFNIP